MQKPARTDGETLLEETLDIATANGTIDVWSMSTKPNSHVPAERDSVR